MQILQEIGTIRKLRTEIHKYQSMGTISTM